MNIDNQTIENYIYLLNQILLQRENHIHELDNICINLYSCQFNETLDTIIAKDENRYIYGEYWDNCIHIPDALGNDVLEIVKTSCLSAELQSQLQHYLDAKLALKKEFKRANELSYKINVLRIAKEKQPTTWQFMPIHILLPESELSEPLSKLIDSIIKEDAENGTGLFGNTTDTVRFEEDIDKLLGVDAYELKSNFAPFYLELHRYGVDALIGKDALKRLFTILEALTEELRAHTDRPNFICNRILDIITAFDKMPLWGIIFQILILQGLCQFLECCTLDEKEYGYANVEGQYSWIQEMLLKKLIRFIYWPIGETDLNLLKPLCEYLYSTESGRLAQECVFSVNEDELKSICLECQQLQFQTPNNEPTSDYKMYFQVLQAIREAGQTMEKLPNNYIGKDENGIRDSFILVLRTCIKDCAVNAESFNCKGKTDILVQNTDGTNICICECKIWRGEQYLSAAIDQLFDRYLTHRDTKAALMIFVQQDGFTNIINKINATCKAHKYFVEYVNSQDKSSFSYIFHHPDDKGIKISLEVLVFHFNKKVK